MSGSSGLVALSPYSILRTETRVSSPTPSPRSRACGQPRSGKGFTDGHGCLQDGSSRAVCSWQRASGEFVRQAASRTPEPRASREPIDRDDVEPGSRARYRFSRASSASLISPEPRSCAASAMWRVPRGSGGVCRSSAPARRQPHGGPRGGYQVGAHPWVKLPWVSWGSVWVVGGGAHQLVLAQPTLVDQLVRLTVLIPPEEVARVSSSVDRLRPTLRRAATQPFEVVDLASKKVSQLVSTVAALGPSW